MILFGASFRRHKSNERQRMLRAPDTGLIITVIGGINDSPLACEMVRLYYGISLKNDKTKKQPKKNDTVYDA